MLQPARSALDELYQSVPALTELRSWDEIKQIAREERAESAAREGLE